MKYLNFKISLPSYDPKKQQVRTYELCKQPLLHNTRQHHSLPLTQALPLRWSGTKQGAEHWLVVYRLVQQELLSKLISIIKKSIGI